MARTKKCPLTKEEQAIARSEIQRIKYERECSSVYNKIGHHIYTEDEKAGGLKDYTPRLLSRSEVRTMISQETYKVPGSIVASKPAPEPEVPAWVGVWLVILTGLSLASNLALWDKVSGG